MIQIRQKQSPFSHEYASKCPILNTPFFLEAWPTKLVVIDQEKRAEFMIACSGPIENFTVFLDLEAGCIRLCYRAKEGYFSWIIQGSRRGVEFRLKRAPLSGVLVDGVKLVRSESFYYESRLNYNQLQSSERLCLGSHKMQEVEKMVKRDDLRELLPLYFRLGQYFKSAAPLESMNVLKNTQICQIRSLFYLSDSIHELLGLEHKPVDDDFFAKSYRLIRDTFFVQEGSHLKFLPGQILFNAGRMTDLRFSFGKLSFIFRKKRVLRIVIDPTCDAKVYLHLPQNFSHFRVLKSLRKKGAIQSSDKAIELKKSTRLYLDKFYL